MSFTLPISTVKASYIGPMRTSLIDHIVMSENVVSAVSAYKTVSSEQDVKNLSGLIPISAEIIRQQCCCDYCF